MKMSVSQNVIENEFRLANEDGNFQNNRLH